MNYELMWNELRKRIADTKQLYFDMKIAGLNDGYISKCYNLLCDIEVMITCIEREEHMRDELKKYILSRKKKESKYYDLEKLLKTPGFTYADTDAIYFEREEKDDVDNH